MAVMAMPGYQNGKDHTYHTLVGRFNFSSTIGDFTVGNIFLLVNKSI
jgi:hypothetical protein